MERSVTRRIFIILVSLGLLSVIAVFPYILTVQKDVFKQIGQPVWVIFMAQFIQSILLFSVLVSLGLYFAGKAGLRLPLLHSIVQKGTYRNVLNTFWRTSTLLGIGTAAAIYLLDVLFAFLGATISTHADYAPAWQKLLAAFYGGIAEEIIMRLFLMSFIVWAIMKVCRQHRAATWNIGISIIVAAVLFGIGHLPITSTITKIDTLTVIRAIVLNGIGGIVFGWLYWKKGLESAMLAHFTTDIVLLTLLPLLFT